MSENTEQEVTTQETAQEPEAQMQVQEVTPQMPPASEPTTESVPEQAPVATPTPTPIPTPAPMVAPPAPVSFLSKALEAIKFRKKAKLEKIMKLAQEKGSITNDQVEKLLHVSDATAGRYLAELVKQNKLRRLGLPQNQRYEPLGGSNGGN